MKRLLVTLIAFTIILGLSCNLLMAQEIEKKEGKAEEKKIEEKKVEEKREVIKEEKATPERQEVKKREGEEIPYDKILTEIRRQREEIRALRNEVTELREMLKNQYAPKKVKRNKAAAPRRLNAPQERWETGRAEAPNIEMEIRELRGRLEQEPRSVDMRMRLAHLYEEVNRIEDAVGQYRAVMDIRPDFDPPYQALRRLGRDVRREPERDKPRQEFSIGEVISSGIEEVKVKVREGDTVNFMVPRRQKEDGTWPPDERISNITKSMAPGKQVRIQWHEVEGRRVIDRIEPPEPGAEKEKPALSTSIGEVISASKEEVKLKNREGETVNFIVPVRKKDDGTWIQDERLSELAKSLSAGKQIVIQWQVIEGQKIIRQIEPAKEQK